MFRNSIFKNASSHFDLKRVSQTQAKAKRPQKSDVQVSLITHTIILSTGILAWGMYRLYQSVNKTITPPEDNNQNTVNTSYKK